MGPRKRSGLRRRDDRQRQRFQFAGEIHHMMRMTPIARRLTTVISSARSRSLNRCVRRRLDKRNSLRPGGCQAARFGRLQRPSRETPGGNVNSDCAETRVEKTLKIDPGGRLEVDTEWEPSG